MTSSGKILAGAFNLLRGKPGAVAIWAAAYLVAAIAVSALAGALAPAEAPLSPDAMRGEAIERLQGMMGPLLLTGALSLFVASVLLCAAFRAMIRPEQRSPGWLRLGGDELRMFGLSVIVLVAALIATVILVLLLMFIATTLAFLTQAAPFLGGLLGFALSIATLCGVIYVMVRLSLMYPLTFIHRRLAIDEAWALSRGRFWTLFPAYLVIALITVVLTCAVVLPFIWPLLEQLPRTEDREAMMAFQAAADRFWAEIPFATLAAMLVLGSAVRGILLALGGGALATAAWGLLAESGKLPENLSAGHAD